MITRPTVLVLGAGASMDFGFPSALKLLTTVAGRLSSRNDMSREICDVARVDYAQVIQFAESLRASYQPSVDAFLENRPEFMEIGKAAIAQELMPREDPEVFRGEERGKSWYEYLFWQLDSGADVDSFRDNTLSVVTFNYDRSLQHSLTVALRDSYGLALDDARRLMAESIPIFHVYGSLGPYDGFYQTSYTPTDLRDAAGRIKIVSERDEDVAVEAQVLISGAERLCFLGFSYNSVNLARLFPQKASHLKAVYGSRYRMRDGETDHVRDCFAAPVNFAGRDDKSLDTLKEFGVLS